MRSLERLPMASAVEDAKCGNCCRLRHPSMDEVLQILSLCNAWDDESIAQSILSGRIPQRVLGLDATSTLSDFFLFEYWGLVSPSESYCPTIEEHCQYVSDKAFVIEFYQATIAGLPCWKAGVFLGIQYGLGLFSPATAQLTPATRISEIDSAAMWKLMMLLDRSSQLTSARKVPWTARARPSILSLVLFLLGTGTMIAAACLFLVSKIALETKLSLNVMPAMFIIGIVLIFGGASVAIITNRELSAKDIDVVAVPGCDTLKDLSRLIANNIKS